MFNRKLKKQVDDLKKKVFELKGQIAKQEWIANNPAKYKPGEEVRYPKFDFHCNRYSLKGVIVAEKEVIVDVYGYDAINISRKYYVLTGGVIHEIAESWINQKEDVSE